MPTGSLNLPYLLLTGAVVVAAVFAFTVLQPALTSVQEVQTEIASVQAQRTGREEFLRTLDAKLAELESNRENEVQLQTVLPADEQMEDALRILNQAAVGSGLTLVSITNDSASVQAQARTQRSRGGVGLPDSVTPLAVGVTLSGPYQGLRSFLTTLERTPRLMDIERISIQRNELTPEVLTTTLSAKFYMLTSQESL